MGQLHPLPKTTTQEEAPLKTADATVSSIEPRCALCGAKLTGRALRHKLVPPQSAHQTITVCHTCNKAALGEGYRPAV
jgi:predicted RNA-binding Zn-ribbon protein involved in translation (DUF1610 family)